MATPAIVLGWAVLMCAQSAPPVERARIALVGDSTVAEGGGWGPGFRAMFGPDIDVLNFALNGRSSKSFLDEGAWAPALAAKPHYILIQFGHNDGPGKGPERETDPATTFRANLLRYVTEARAIGAHPILVTSIVRRNLSPDGKVRPDTLVPYVEAVRAFAAERGILVMDMYDRTREQCESLGPTRCAELNATAADGSPDTTHLGAAGQRDVGIVAAREFARVVLPAQPNVDLKTIASRTLLPMNRARTIYAMPEPASPTLPTLFVLGDSTVGNEHGEGRQSLWGWGDVIGDRFNLTRINVVNRAIPGLSSRTYLTYGHWDRVLTLMKAGDVVVMQFGHNDAAAINDATRARGSLTGTGDDAKEIDNLATGEHEVVHTYGWYLRRLISDAKARRANVIVCAPVPRNQWKDGHVVQAESYRDWARDVAGNNAVAFIDLAGRVARRYESLGQSKVAALFPTDNTHTNRAGAGVIADEVVAAIRAQPGSPLTRFLK